jgi:hypothetical protein
MSLSQILTHCLPNKTDTLFYPSQDNELACTSQQLVRV